MIVERRISIIRMIRQIWVRLVVIALVAYLSVASRVVFDLSDLAISTSVPLIIGTAISIFLGFRTNSAYSRWWEARILWGKITVESLNLGRIVRDHLDGSPESEKFLKTICDRQTAWAYALDQQLKGKGLAEECGRLLQESEFNDIRESSDVTFQILLNQSCEISRAVASGQIDKDQSRLIHETLNRLTDHMGGCHRIKSTDFPVHYAYFTKAFIWIFLVLLGLSLPTYETDSETINFATSLPATFLIGWVFLTVDGIGDYVQAPFEDNRNVIPMRTLSRRIEVGLKMIRGDKDIPPFLQPKDGMLN